jgi:hydroxyacylglutathione hydrolase
MHKRVRAVVVGPFQVNCYLLYDEELRDAVIIDPGADEHTVFDEIEQLEITPRAVLLTHGHGDHIAAVEAVKAEYGIPVYVGAGEEALLADPSANISAFFDKPIVAPKPDGLLVDEQVIKFGSVVLTVLATPGHTSAGVCYLEETQGLLFCGDTLFAGSIGRTDLPGASHTRLLESIQRKILSLPDSVICLPGHGPRTTVGAERASNPFLVGGQYA